SIERCNDGLPHLRSSYLISCFHLSKCQSPIPPSPHPSPFSLMIQFLLIALLISPVFSAWNINDSLCKDRANPTTGKNECEGFSHLCSIDGYSVIMTQECPKTCGRCGCVDLPNPSSGITSCSSLRDKCNDASYKARMAVQCKKTCGLC
ncbi:hypothetical protein PENTCL1PPCAC_22476, partial [Pristionchus entomophagus]